MTARLMLDWVINRIFFPIFCLSLALIGWYATDMNAGAIASMKELGITESYKLKRQVVLSASEATEMILVSAIQGLVG
jgi:hypothetical protein